MDTSSRIFKILKATAMFGVNAVALLFSNINDNDDLDERPLQDSGLSGEYNHRTGRLDAGTDPYGWYEEDMK